MEKLKKNLREVSIFVGTEIDFRNEKLINKLSSIFESEFILNKLTTYEHKINNNEQNIKTTNRTSGFTLHNKIDNFLLLIEEYRLALIFNCNNTSCDFNFIKKIFESILNKLDNEIENFSKKSFALVKLFSFVKNDQNQMSNDEKNQYLDIFSKISFNNEFAIQNILDYSKRFSFLNSELPNSITRVETQESWLSPNNKIFNIRIEINEIKNLNQLNYSYNQYTTSSIIERFSIAYDINNKILEKLLKVDEYKKFLT